MRCCESEGVDEDEEGSGSVKERGEKVNGM